MATITDIERMLHNIISALHNSNRMDSAKWRLAALRMASEDLKELADVLDKQAEEIRKRECDE